MTDQTINPHAAFQDNLAIYLSGGLSPDEATAFESHAAACPECAASLAVARKSDQAMRSLFAPLSPDQEFEDRLIAGMRKPQIIRRLHPMVRLAASGVAAAVVLGAVGYYGGRLVNKPHLLANAAAAFGGHGKTTANGIEIVGGTQLTRSFSAATQPSADDWGIHSDGVQTKTSSRNLTRGEKQGFRFFYQQPAGEVSTVSALPAQSLARRVEPNGVSNLKSGERTTANNMARDKMSDDQKKMGVEGERVVPYDEMLKYPANWPDGSKNRQPAFQHHVNVNKELPDAPQHGQDAINGTQHAVDKLEMAEAKSPTAATAQPTASVLGPVEFRRVTNHYTGGTEVAAAQPTASAPGSLGNSTAIMPEDVALVAQVVPGSTPATPPTTSDGSSVAPPTTQASIATTAAAAQKIIRTGTMEFEVDSFDSAFVQITKIVAEEGGFVAATDSDKLENGKVKGTVTLRCPPEHLDTLVLKLRGLGDLKTQRITAQDVTRQFTDYESQLRAARAMEDRLLEIIKTGKGTVKDLVEAEKQLGVYRQQIEQIEGELRYMGSQVAMSTLSVSLMERDIRTPFAAVEAEQISAGIEAEDVEHARAEALKLIDDAKGRVIESELKKLDAGQLAATVVAEVSPDAAGALGDRLKQLGRVARWEATRKQTTEGGNGSPMQLPPKTKLERQPTRFSLSIYNLANVAPRQITSLTLVSNDVEAAYRSILAAMNGNAKTPAIGRVITSNLTAQKSDQETGSITLEVKSDQAPAIEAALRSAGSVMHLTVTENPDQNGVTDAKRGYGITLIAAANVPAREQQSITAASKDVGATYNKLLALLRDPKESARVINSQLTEPQEDNVTGSVDFEIPIASRPAVDALLSDGKQSDVISRNVVRSADTENTLADKLHLTVSIGSAERLPPHETTRLTLETADVAKALDTAAASGQSDARVTERSLNQQPDGRSIAHIAIDVPLSDAQTTLDELRSLGKVASAESSRDARVTAGPLARARFEVELENAPTLVPPQDGMSASIQRGLRTALNGLLWSVQMVVVGLVLVVPFVLVIWVAWKLVRRGRKSLPDASASA